MLSSKALLKTFLTVNIYMKLFVFINPIVNVAPQYIVLILYLGVSIRDTIEYIIVCPSGITQMCKL